MLNKEKHQGFKLWNETGFLGKTTKKFDTGHMIMSLVAYHTPVSEDWHFHREPHLSLILRGGNKEIRKRNHLQATVGKIMLYPAGEFHRNTHTLYPSLNLNLEIRNDFFSQHNLKFHNFQEHAPCKFILHRMLYELQNDLPGSYEQVHNYAHTLFHAAEINHFPPWLNKVRNCLQDRWNEFVPLKELSIEFRVHPVTISSGFKKYYGLTLVEYQRQLKLSKAYDMLLQSRASITEIAHYCGFSDHSHLTRLFKLQMGFTPKAFQQI